MPEQPCSRSLAYILQTAGELGRWGMSWVLEQRSIFHPIQNAKRENSARKFLSSLADLQATVMSEEAKICPASLGTNRATRHLRSEL